ncbi:MULTISPECIES: FAD/NAD(P)-binding protein [Corynebacterium]|uniref:FAD/NAD(P)-binding protein n=1 Tax=Corynebacterium TaxID=1716 RepID=UPI001956C9E2|nr:MULTISPECIES: FAD/NAD(P)-binding protein [Corynebacterium]MDN8624733.1 FAD/NAD(P)-binding protein [Corynebacterium kroppenstedtii]QRQ65654.1 FAD/NAD(P)-binding protein [Corynebacterium kroppenstedtii]
MRTIAIVGGGPRGISVLERLGSLLQDSSDQAAADGNAMSFSVGVTIHLIDDVEPGAGRVWRTDQSPTLCMNTLADAVTLFTEPGSTVRGPVLEGPTLYEWFQLLRGDAVHPRPTDTDSSRARMKTDLFREFPPTMPVDYEAEIRQARPESHPSRALYGHYLRWVFGIAVDRLRIIPGVTVQIHKARAVNIRLSDEGADGDVGTGVHGGDDGPVGKQKTRAAQTSSRDTVTLSDGTSVDADATILALGWTDTTANTAESVLGASVAAHPNLTWIHPGHPADQDLDSVADGHGTSKNAAPNDSQAHRPDVIVRGLGMGFFDLMARLTIDRGGEYQRTSSSPFDLSYKPSGREPRLIVTSHHGYPYQPKPVFGSLPPAAPMPRLKSAIQALPSDSPAGSIDFSTTLWPAILRDAQAAYYRVLLRGSDEALSQILRIIDDPTTDPWSLHNDPRLDGLVVPPDRFDLPYYADPMSRIAAELPEATDSDVPDTESAIRALTKAVKEALKKDLAEARRGRESAVKAGLQVIGAARKTVAIADEPGQFTPESRRRDYAEFVRIGANVGSGPPAFRTAELIALIDAGLVVFAGADPIVGVTIDHDDEPQFVLTSPTTGAHPVYSTTLIDAWQHKPNVTRSADPLTRALVASGRMRPFALHTPHEDSATRDGESSKRHLIPTRAPEVDMKTCRIIHSDGATDPRIHMLGIPLQEMRADTTISPMPGTDPLMLQETDAAAASALGIPRG